MCGSTLYCGLEGSRRHSPSRSSTCGVRLGLPSFNWRSLTLPVSVLALVGAVLCDFYMDCLFVGLIDTFQDRCLLPHHFTRLDVCTYHLLYEKACFSLVHVCCIELVLLTWMQDNTRCF